MEDILDKLWKPNSYCSNDELGKLYKKSKKNKLSLFPEFLINRDSYFLEKTFKNLIWKVFYLLFPWLYSIENCYLSSCKDVCIKLYPRFNSESFIWYDHCLAWITSLFRYFYLKCFFKQLNYNEIKMFHDFLVESCKGIKYFINLPKFKRHNHFIFHGLCCLDLSLLFNELELRNIGVTVITRYI